MSLQVNKPDLEEQRDVVLPIQEQGDRNTNCISPGTDEEQLPYPALAPVVFLCLRQTTRPRNWCLKIVRGPWLNYVSLLMSLFTCVIQGMYEPCAGSNSTLQALDVFAFAYFVVEILIKTVALGLFGHRGSVVSSNWNKFDMLIIFVEIVSYVLALCGINLEICNTLKPMRLISRVPPVKDLVLILLDTLPMLGNVLILYAFVVHIFAVVGIQLWAGQLLNRCFLGEDIITKYNVSLSPYFVSVPGEKTPFICSPNKGYGMRHCEDVPPYRNNGKICTLAAPDYGSSPNVSVPAVAGGTTSTCINWNMYYNVCQTGNQNPNMGAINFDNIGYAWITIFQVVTLEGWTDIMHFFMDSYSFWSFGYFILVTIMGSTIIMNVCAVVIATHFSEALQSDTVEHDAGAVYVQSLCSKFTSWLRRISHTRVQPSDSIMEKNAPLVQAWIPLQEKLKVMVDSNLFNRVIMLAIFVNIFAMAIEHYGQPPELTVILQITNTFFTILFLLEMIVKLLALSWMYFADRDNIFDFVIVIISLWEITSKADSKLSVMRAFRVLRFGRLVHFLPYLRRQLLVLKRTIGKSATLCWLMLFVIFIFSLLGMYLFGCKFSYRSENGQVISNRSNFDSLLWSMVTVFQILTQEDWHLVLYTAMASTSPWAVVYFVAIIVLGKHVLLNVLVGIVVENYQAMPSERSEQESSAAASGSAGSITTSLITKTDPAGTTQGCSFSPHEPSKSAVIESSHEGETAPTDADIDNRPLRLIQQVRCWCKEHEDWSLYVFSPQNCCRRVCQRVSSHSAFDLVVLLFIILSCITIAMERPSLHPESTEQWLLDISSYVFSAVFLVEMLVKVIALGLLFGKDSYCSSPWNIMDGVLVIFSLAHIFIEVVTSGKNNVLGILKVFRLLRTLRPLRVIKRTPKLKLAVEALIASVKPMGNIVLICSVFFFFFGIFGVQLFKGAFYHCVGQDIRNITNKTDCLAANYSWVRKQYNFDNLPEALISLFVMYSKDGWVNIMYDGLDAVGADEQPVKNYNEWMLLYFISFMIMSFFLLDMFIGVMVETFHQCQQEQRRGDELERAALQDQHKEPEQIPYYTHYSPIRRRIHTLCTGKILDYFITFIIVLSVLVMAAEHYNEPEYVRKLMEYSQYVFTLILIIELLLKLVAFGVMRFLKNRWNLLDVAVVLASIISIVFSEMKMSDTIPINPSILRVFRVLRLSQVLKAKTIRVLLKTVIKTLSQVGNISLLFMFFFFIFAVLGVELFGKLECSIDYPCNGLDRHANFKHFGMALITLYKVCTGDNWSGIMKDTLRECRPNDDNCSSYLRFTAPIYLASFVIMAQFGLVNLVVAAIMQALEDCSENKPANSGLPLVDEDQPATQQTALSAGEPASSEQHKK